MGSPSLLQLCCHSTTHGPCLWYCPPQWVTDVSHARQSVRICLPLPGNLYTMSLRTVLHVRWYSVFFSFSFRNLCFPHTPPAAPSRAGVTVLLSTHLIH